METFATPANFLSQNHRDRRALTPAMRVFFTLEKQARDLSVVVGERAERRGRIGKKRAGREGLEFTAYFFFSGNLLSARI